MFSFISFVVLGAFVVGGGGSLMEIKYGWQLKHEVPVYTVLIDLNQLVCFSFQL